MKHSMKSVVKSSGRMRTTRRRFLAGTAGLGAAALFPTIGCKSSEEPSTSTLMGADGDAVEELPWFQISLAQWSLHRALSSGELDHLDFAKAARRDYGIEGIEYVNSFFKAHARDQAFLGQMKTRAADQGVRSLLIMVDGEGNLGAAGKPQRAQAVANHHQWIEAAAFLGCHSIRVNAGGSGSREEVARRAAESLHALATYGAPHSISVLVENHGGYSSDGAWLADVMRRADHPGVGTLPDFGNFRISGGPDGDVFYDRYQGVAELMPFAKAVSAKSYDFDAAGNETTIDFERMLGIVAGAGYHQWIGVEYEGGRLSEPEGIRATKALLERLR